MRVKPDVKPDVKPRVNKRVKPTALARRTNRETCEAAGEAYRHGL
jgi:hypothetical protein